MTEKQQKALEDLVKGVTIEKRNMSKPDKFFFKQLRDDIKETAPEETDLENINELLIDALSLRAMFLIKSDRFKEVLNEFSKVNGGNSIIN